MLRTIIIGLLLITHTFLISQSLSISENGRYIEKEDGNPFMWIGDTAWELFHKLNREEAIHYLKTRAEQGFTLIQAVVLAENDGLRKPNSYGDLPLINLDPERPNGAYFKHVDFIIQKANELGLVVGLLPTWGDKVYSEHPGSGPVVFNADNAEKFGAFLGQRYKNDEIIWILGGDRNIANLEVLEIWRAMAKGLSNGDDSEHLITYHPRGESSSSYFLHNESWLDFNMYQSGHSNKYNRVYNWAETDYLKQKTKPFVDGEPAYEGISVKFWNFLDWTTANKVPDGVLDDQGIIQDLSYFKDGFFYDYDVRIHAYWNFLSGACGYTYGNNAVWQMFKKSGPIAIPCIADWKESLYHTGATQLIHLKNLFSTYLISDLVPDQSIVFGRNSKNEGHIRAATSLKNNWVIIYLAKGQPVDVVMGKINTKNVLANWHNPRNGAKTKIGTFLNEGIVKFIPPSSGIGNDWVLILEDEVFNK